MLNWVLSVLVLKEVISKEEAQTMSKELVLKTHPSNFDEAYRIVEKLLDNR